MVFIAKEIGFTTLYYCVYSRYGTRYSRMDQVKFVEHSL